MKEAKSIGKNRVGGWRDFLDCVESISQMDYVAQQSEDELDSALNCIPIQLLIYSPSENQHSI